MVVYYAIVFGLSVLLTVIYLFVWNKHFNPLIMMMFILLPIANLSYLFFSFSTNLEEAFLAYRLTYIGGCFLLLINVVAIFSLCKIETKKWMRFLFVVLSTTMFIFAQTGPETNIFYKNVSFEIIDGVATLHKEYGVMHTAFYVMVITYFVISLAGIIYSALTKKETSRKIIVILFFGELLCCISFFITKIFKLNIEIVPLGYLIGSFTFLLIVSRISLYDIDNLAIDTIVENKDTAFIAIDFKFNYLGSNALAKEILPELKSYVIDKHIKMNENGNAIYNYIEKFINDETKNKYHFEKDDKSYLLTINYLYNYKKKSGYQIAIKDDTKNQEYIKLLNNFNINLKDEVEQKTKNISLMHDSMIIGMATMVESRDNSTGGHIKRTSDGIKIIVNEMQKDNLLTPEFARNLIKAAPMHDLGKICIDDAILRKPGKFSPEEFDIMKTHAENGYKIIQEIVDEKYDKAFKTIALNVARYHHERVDGSGYPLGLKGEEIPLEARIMAIIDVYDALVSKRVYKEKFSYEKANEIIMDGMGSQFDKNLEKYFVQAREKLEEYYNNLENK